MSQGGEPLPHNPDLPVSDQSLTPSVEQQIEDLFSADTATKAIDTHDIARTAEAIVGTDAAPETPALALSPAEELERVETLHRLEQMEAAAQAEASPATPFSPPEQDESRITGSDAAMHLMMRRDFQPRSMRAVMSAVYDHEAAKRDAGQQPPVPPQGEA